MKDQTEITAVEVLQPELSKLVTNSKIELTKAEAHAMAFMPSLATLAELSRPLADLDKVNPTPEHAKIARENRLKIVKVRTGGETIKDDRKSLLLLEANFIQDACNHLKSACALTESEYLEIEKHQEKIEAEAKAKLAAERIVLLTEYEVETTYLPLGEMTDGQFQAILSKGKEAFEAIQETRRQAEVKRLADEKEAEEKELKRLLHNERFIKIAAYPNFVNQDLGELSIMDFKNLFDGVKLEHEKAIAAKEAEDKRIREENEALRLAKEEAEKKADLIAKHNEKINARTNELHKIGLKFDFASTFSGFGFFIDVLDIQTYDDKKWATLIAKIETKIEEAENDKILTCAKNANEAIEFLLSIGYIADEDGVSHPDYHSFIGSAHFSFFDTDEDLQVFKAEKLAYDLKQREQIAADIKSKSLAEENEKLKSKQDAIDLANGQEKQRIEQEEADKLAQEKAARNLPDVEKLRGVYTFFNSYTFPEMSTQEGKDIVKDLMVQLISLTHKITEHAKKLK